MIGKTLSHYRIVEKIGAGGMGEVYRAHDERLDRDVAIKVLPAGTLTDETARKRFRKEALALAKLNHPNIETVHDFDTQDGVDFLVMEHIPGVTLSEKLATGPLPEKEIAHLGAQMAEGLAAAHKENIIHRDIKPGNLGVTPDGRVKILDFGIAKLLRPVSATATTESFTETHAMAGTLPYMAPEQLREGTADHRSDLYSLGVVLYEMATGQRPFQQKLSTALAADIQTKPPPAPRRHNATISARLEDLILKCLEKDPGLRYQSAAELVADLKRFERDLGLSHVSGPPTPASDEGTLVQTGNVKIARRGDSMVIDVVEGKEAIHLAIPAKSMKTTLGVVVVALMLVGAVLMERAGWFDGKPDLSATPAISSLAVLPLENLMGDSEQDYFVDGMAEALIADLAQIGSLKVISRTSAMRYKESDKSLPEIAQELGVDGLIEGSVLRAGDQVRITVQLIHGATDEHLWAESYERDLRDVLALQGEVAQAIAEEIKIAVTPEEEARLASARPVNPEAHEAYLKGRYFWNKRTEEALKTSLEYFARAIEKDSDYAAAYAGLADSYLHLAHYSGLPPQEAMAKAEAATLKALDIDLKLAEAHASLGHLRMHEWNWSVSEKELKRAVELNPNYAIVHYWYAALLSQMGRHPEAVAESDRAVELDPLSLMINTTAGAARYWARRYDPAIEQFQRTLALDPNFVPARQDLGLAYAQKGLYDEAVAELKEARNLPGAGARGAALLAYAYAVGGETRQAVEILDELKEVSKQGRLPSYEIAAVHAALGQKEQAFAWLEKAYGERDSWLVFVKVEPMFDPLRGDPRFQALLRRMNFPE
ncbi:MAG: protein kinase [Terriglobia bacterium]